MYSTVVSDVGTVRSNNQDSAFAGEHLIAICDGMGGHLAGEGASGRVISRSVAQDESQQIFYPRMIGDAAGFGHVQCDSIIMDDAHIESIPAIVANSTEAQLIHEAAIGKIAGEQIIKLMTLGLTEQEAEEQIISGFLK